MRSRWQRIVDGLTFPLRAVTLFYKDRLGMSSLASERYDYVAREVQGHTLDVGCGEYNRFIDQVLKGNGKGIDVFPYDGLTSEHLVDNLDVFPFQTASFDSVTFIANINHVPRSKRDIELAEAHRCLKPGGNIIVTMGNPVAEYLVHKVVYFYDKCLGTKLDHDNQRGMHEEEAYFLTDGEIVSRLLGAGFINIRKKYFLTQWCLNHLFVGWKPNEAIQAPRQRVA